MSKQLTQKVCLTVFLITDNMDVYFYYLLKGITKMVQLKHLNLQYNLFSDVMQLNRLRIMTSISEVIDLDYS